MTGSVSDIEALEKLFVPRASGFTILFDIQIDKVQVRKHRQKRINKKWAKRYGYKPVLAPYSGDIDAFNDNGDGTFSFVAENIGRCNQYKGQDL